jgi:hypothetical protein
VNNKVSDYTYYLLLSDVSLSASLSGEQGYLCLKRFLEEGKERVSA